MIDSTNNDYRRLSTLSVLSGTLGVLSVLAWTWPPFVAVAALAVMCGGITMLRLRGRSADIAGLRLAIAGGAISATCLFGSALWHWHRYDIEVPAGFERVELCDVFDANVEDVTPALLALQGRQVSVKAYMDPFHTSDGVATFTISRMDSTGFGATARPGEQLTVELARGMTCEYSDVPVVVSGMFDIQTRAAGDGPRFRLVLRDASLQPATSSIGVLPRNPRAC